MWLQVWCVGLGPGTKMQKINKKTEIQARIARRKTKQNKQKYKPRKKHLVLFKATNPHFQKCTNFKSPPPQYFYLKTFHLTQTFLEAHRGCKKKKTEDTEIHHIWPSQVQPTCLPIGIWVPLVVPQQPEHQENFGFFVEF